MGDMKNSIHGSNGWIAFDLILCLAQSVGHHLSVSNDCHVAIVERCVEERDRVIPMSTTDTYFLNKNGLGVNWYNVIISIPTTTQRH